MQVLRSESLVPVPWKNGGGITREVARRDGPDGWLWRISIADVDQSGPFSRFEGQSRILTVFHGAGIDLFHAAGVLPARPLVPVHFSGDIAIEGRLIDGPIRDVNVIYDAARATAEVSVVRGPTQLVPKLGILAVCCLEGSILADGTVCTAADVVIATEGRIDVAQASIALAIRLIEH